MELIYGDTSFWVAYLMPDEDKHEVAEKYAEGIQNAGNAFFITNFVLQEAIGAIRRKYALKPNENRKNRIRTAERLSKRNDPQGFEHTNYMKGIDKLSKERVEQLVDLTTNDTTHFRFETPDGGATPLTVYEVFRQGLSITSNNILGKTRPVFPSPEAACRTCFAAFKEPFLTFKAVGAQDVLHILMAVRRACARFVTLDHDFDELRAWALGQIQIDML